MSKTEESMELVVLEGEQAGARTIIRPGRSLSLGATLDDDIVLRDPEVVGTRVKLKVGDAALNLEVAVGEVAVGDKKLIQGEETEIPPYMAMRIGGSTIAYGKTGSAHWQELIEELKQSDEKALVDTAADIRGRKDIQHIGRVMLFMFIGLGLLIALFAGGRQSKTPLDPVKQLVQLTELIEQMEFAGLQVEQKEDGGLSIVGYLEEARQRASLETMLADHSIVATLKIQVGEDLAAEVKDIYRVQGINAEVEPLGEKRVKVNTREVDISHLKSVQEDAIRDAGLEEVVASNVAPLALPEAMPPADPGRAVTMVVAGEPAYVVTDEKTRYFVGALLPTGHRIAAITSTSVLLEKNGDLTTLNF